MPNSTSINCLTAQAPVLKQINPSLAVRLTMVLALFFLGGRPLLLAQADYATPYAVTNLAGNPNVAGGFANGTGGAALFNGPWGVAVDGSNNVYVADTNNNCIRKITPGGVVSTYAGNPSAPAGFANGSGSAVRFNTPTGVAVDTSNNVYVADSLNNSIREITPGGTVTSLPGSGNGFALPGEYNTPEGVAVDGSGNVYVADTGNSCIRKITGGTVSNLAGIQGIGGHVNGPGATAEFNQPEAVAVDGSGNVYVADSQNYLVRKITSNGGVATVSTLAGSAGTQGTADGLGTAAQFSELAGVAVDGSNNVYVADAPNNTIRKITPGGAVSTLAGGPNGSDGTANGTGTAAQFDEPSGVAVDGSNNLYVGDTYNDTIREGTVSHPFGGYASGPSGAYYSPWFGFYNNTYYPFIYRYDLGYIYVYSSDDANYYLYVFNGNAGVSMGWIYTSQPFFPFVYDFTDDDFLYFFPGGITFYNFGTGQYETY